LNTARKDLKTVGALAAQKTGNARADSEMRGPTAERPRAARAGGDAQAFGESASFMGELSFGEGIWLIRADALTEGENHLVWRVTYPFGHRKE